MAKAFARPIKTKRDYKGAASAANKIREQTEREPAAEHRLQALIDAMAKFDDQAVDEDPGDAPEDIDGLLRRRWSDDTPE